MLSKLRSHLKKQEGFCYFLECVCVCTFCFCIYIIGSGLIGSSVLGEFGDFARAIGSLNQSYTSTGLAVGHPNDPTHPTDVATWAGSSFVDTLDFCDQGGGGVRNCIAPAPEALGGGAGPPPPIGP
ncbi:MAG: hypothetical protein V3T72_00305 [Thermoanaerobaculia bacterium]